jgi:hypothetical protein
MIFEPTSGLTKSKRRSDIAGSTIDIVARIVFEVADEQEQAIGGLIEVTIP